MTPAVEFVRKNRISHEIHQYVHDPSASSYGLEAADALGVAPEQVFKTLVVSLDGIDTDLAVAMVPVSFQLDLKALARALGVRKVRMADPKIAGRATGYVVGGISPLGQKKRLPMVLDESAASFATVFVSAGKRGLEIELSPGDLASATRSITAVIRR